MKNNKTALALAQVLNEAGIPTGGTHTQPGKNLHYVQIKSIDDVEKALKVATEKGFVDVKQAGVKGRVSLPNPTLKTVRKKAQSKKAPKKAPKKAATKPASNKTSAKRKRSPSDTIPVQAKILVDLISGITAPNVRYRVVESIIRKMPDVSMKSMLRKLGYCSSLKKTGSVDLSKISEAALKRELSKRWKKK